MKKTNLATKKNTLEVVCAEKLPGSHDHVHAANCGHKSYVHNGHICYEHDGHFHYWHQDHFHACAGPHAGAGKGGQKQASPAQATTPQANRDRFKLVDGAKGKNKK